MPAGVLFLTQVAVGADALPRLDDAQLDWLGQQIFRNECNLSVDCLTAWNAGEDFPSLGIGHFIWYQRGQREIFEETFPALLRFMEDRDVDLPEWLNDTGVESPWPDRAAFQADFNSDRTRELRRFLTIHISEQTAFIASRFEDSLERMLADSSAADAARIRTRFFAVAAASPPLGLYALIDYVNFKGTGTNPAEHYRGQGWGLKQVLLAMPDDGEPLAGFAETARAVLRNRVDNAPEERNESRWLAGWNNRIDTYGQAAILPTVQSTAD